MIFVFAIASIILIAVVVGCVFYSPKTEELVTTHVNKVKIFEPVEERFYLPIDVVYPTFHSSADEANIYETSEISVTDESELATIFGEGVDLLANDEEETNESLKGTSYYEPIERGVVSWEADVLEINRDLVYLFIHQYQCKRWYVIDNPDQIEVGESLQITLDLGISEELITDYKKILLN